MDNANMSKSFHEFGHNERSAGTFLAVNAPLISAKLRKQREDKIKLMRKERFEEEHDKRLSDWRLVVEREDARKRQAEQDRERRVREIREREIERRRLFDERRAELERRQDERRQKIVEKLNQTNGKSPSVDTAHLSGKRCTSAYAFGSSTPRKLSYLTTPTQSGDRSISHAHSAVTSTNGFHAAATISTGDVTPNNDVMEMSLRGAASSMNLGRRPVQSAKLPSTNMKLISMSMHFPSTMSHRSSTTNHCAVGAAPVPKQLFPIRQFNPKTPTTTKGNVSPQQTKNVNTVSSARMTRSFISPLKSLVQEDRTSTTLNERRRSSRIIEAPTVNEKHTIAAKENKKSEANVEKKKQIELKTEAEEEQKRIEEEKRKIDAENLRIELARQEEREELRRIDEARLAEQKRLRLAIEEEAWRRQEEEMRKAEAKRKQIEAETKLKEAQQRLDRERREAEERMRKEEEERLGRKRKLEAIMQRTRNSAASGGQRSPSAATLAAGEDDIAGDRISPTSGDVRHAAALLQRCGVVGPGDIGRSVENIMAKVRLSAANLNKNGSTTINGGDRTNQRDLGDTSTTHNISEAYSTPTVNRSTVANGKFGLYNDDDHDQVDDNKTQQLTVTSVQQHTVAHNSIL